MNMIRYVRTRKGYSQREFAKRTLLSFRGVQLLEGKNHNWRLSSIQKVAVALGLPEAGIGIMIRHFLEQDSSSIMIASIRILTDGPASWPLHLFNFVDAFRSTVNEDLVHAAPVEALDTRTKALLASTVETLCSDLRISIPEWCDGIRGLAEPWFVAGIESLKPMALVESPVRFRKRNIFVLGNFMDRA